MNIKFYYCEKCDNLVEITNLQNHDIHLDKEGLKELVPNTVDAAVEKHVPYVEMNGNTVKISIGEVIHPMTEEHYIKAIYVVTEKGTIYRKYLTPKDTPTFEIENIDSAHFDVYSYCNLHGMWKKSI